MKYKIADGVRLKKATKKVAVNSANPLKIVNFAFSGAGGLQGVGPGGSPSIQFLYE